MLELSVLAQPKQDETHMIELATTIVYWHVTAFANVLAICE